MTKRKRNIRQEIQGLYAAPEAVARIVFWPIIDRWLSMLEYALAVPSRRKRIEVNVDEMVEKWETLVTNLTLATDRDTVDKYEHQLNEHLEPFLTCPVKQIREFCRKLVVRLEANSQLPWFLKRSIEAYIKIFVEDATDKGVLKLKKGVAARIAESVEPDVRPQLSEAIANALMWRSPKQLQEIEQAIESEHKAGRKARLKGKESCLFIEAGDKTIQL